MRRAQGPVEKGEGKRSARGKIVTKTLLSSGGDVRGRPRDGRVRLFFGLWPSPELATSLGALAVELSGSCGGRAVPPENLHLTLAFLGSVPGPRVNAAVAAAQRALRTRDAADDALFRLEEIRYWEKAGIVHATPREASPRLLSLAHTLEASLRAAEFVLESRNFVPHVTLVRRAERAPAGVGLSGAACDAWPEDEVRLVRSTQGPRTSVYTSLARIPI